MSVVTRTSTTPDMKEISSKKEEKQDSTIIFKYSVREGRVKHSLNTACNENLAKISTSLVSY